MFLDLLLLVIKHQLRRFELKHQARKDGSSPEYLRAITFIANSKNVDLRGLRSMILLAKGEANQNNELMIFDLINFNIAIIFSFFLRLWLINGVKTQLVPAVFLFGDSVLDVGNNNNLPTVIKSNFLPYGRDFTNHTPTGRFSNGKLAIDYLVDTLAFESYPSAYLNTNATDKNLLIGANFASAASGYDDSTADLYLTVSLTKQLENYGEYQRRVVGMVGEEKASSIFSGGLYVISAGTSDFLQNYHISPTLQATYPTAEQYFVPLLKKYAQFVENLYSMGARKIGVTSLPPLGCLPGSMTLFGFGNDQCVEKLNYEALSFNKRLNSTSQTLRNRLSTLNLVVLDIYQPLYNLIKNPKEHGFKETEKGCCGTGLVESSILCNKLSIGTCSNASDYVFWDSFHPSEAANNILANDMITAGTSLVF
ncbi:GDSL esterase/lipase At5g03810-like [Humulus lupulus]|uniref:GDSL esterase/lipase At5g03810-like n=1 Tax=Humulus lupulus TaxID=3486 RepID=UPI002B40BFAC|nr:GDSL esterase/lipase At5g03810-like [Humulus lupulus]